MGVTVQFVWKAAKACNSVKQTQSVLCFKARARLSKQKLRKIIYNLNIQAYCDIKLSEVSLKVTRVHVGRCLSTKVLRHKNAPYNRSSSETSRLCKYLPIPAVDLTLAQCFTYPRIRFLPQNLKKRAIAQLSSQKKNIEAWLLSKSLK